jgi:hypothetical protein
MSGMEDDRLSLELNGFYDYKERIEDDFNLFESQEGGGLIEEGLFYSKREI